MAIVTIVTHNDADFHRTFLWQTAEGTPINMTGMTLEMMLRRRAEDQIAVLRLATDTGEITLIDPINGRFAVRISQDELERLGLGDFDQSCIATYGTAKMRVWSGTLTNNAGATR